MTDELDTDDMLAAEYALGLLDAAALEGLRKRAQDDPALARRIVGWEARLSQLADLDPVPPPKAAKAAVLNQLFPPAARASLWQRLGLWRALTGAAVAAACVLAVMVWETGPRGNTGPLYTAQIVSETQDFRVVAVVDKSRNEVFLTRTAGAAPQGRILQVWAHGPDAPAQSVGLWPEGESVRLPLPAQIAAVQGTLTLGVSEEPPGGSPTGSPSGRVFGTVDIPNVTSGN